MPKPEEEELSVPTDEMSDFEKAFLNLDEEEDSSLKTDKDKPEEDPPKEDPPKEDPPKEDPPKEDPPKEDPPAPVPDTATEAVKELTRVLQEQNEAKKAAEAEPDDPKAKAAAEAADKRLAEITTEWPDLAEMITIREGELTKKFEQKIKDLEARMEAKVEPVAKNTAQLAEDRFWAKVGKAADTEADVQGTLEKWITGMSEGASKMGFTTIYENAKTPKEAAELYATYLIMNPDAAPEKKEEPTDTEEDTTAEKRRKLAASSAPVDKNRSDAPAADNADDFDSAFDEEAAALEEKRRKK